MQALRTDRVNHAYLFRGPRGCGKTTSARILARCLNCEQGPTPTPCGVCDSCVALARGGAGSLDVVEIDAASHGGVDDARDLRERAFFAPAPTATRSSSSTRRTWSRRRASTPCSRSSRSRREHVKFIFATTEPDKVIGTIRSRTHHYPFRLVPPARLPGYLERALRGRGRRRRPRRAAARRPRRRRFGARHAVGARPAHRRVRAPRASTTRAPSALLGYTDAALLDDVVDAFAAGDGGRRVPRRRPGHRVRARPAAVRRGPARAPARPDRRRGGPRRRAARCCAACPRTSSSGCARRPRASARAELSRGGRHRQRRR